MQKEVNTLTIKGKNREAYICKYLCKNKILLQRKHLKLGKRSRRNSAQPPERLKSED